MNISNKLYEAIKQASRDMHLPSMRPCDTCRKMTKSIGEPYGCYAYQKRIQDIEQLKKEDKP